MIIKSKWLNGYGEKHQKARICDLMNVRTADSGALHNRDQQLVKGIKVITDTKAATATPKERHVLLATVLEILLNQLTQAQSRPWVLLGIFSVGLAPTVLLIKMGVLFFFLFFF